MQRKRFKVGDKLFTKDGRQIGNAKITDMTIMVVDPEYQYIFGSRFVMVYTIVTDYGNTARFTYKELLSHFWFSREITGRKW